MSIKSSPKSSLPKYKINKLYSLLLELMLSIYKFCFELLSEKQCSKHNNDNLLSNRLFLSMFILERILAKRYLVDSKDRSNFRKLAQLFRCDNTYWYKIDKTTRNYCTKKILVVILIYRGENLVDHTSFPSLPIESPFHVKE